MTSANYETPHSSKLLHPLVTSYLLGLIVFLSTLFSNTLNDYSLVFSNLYTLYMELALTLRQLKQQWRDEKKGS